MMPRQEKSQQESDTKLAIKATGTDEVTRKLLSDSSKQAYITSSREKLISMGQAENLDFLVGLKKFRDNPPVGVVKELKRTYIDSIDDDVDFPKVSKDQFGVPYQTQSINITDQAR